MFDASATELLARNIRVVTRSPLQGMQIYRVNDRDPVTFSAWKRHRFTTAGSKNSDGKNPPLKKGGQGGFAPCFAKSHISGA